MFTECEAADLKGLWEQERGRESRSQALAACINPEGNQTQGHGVEEQPPGKGWLHVLLAHPPTAPLSLQLVFVK